MDISLWAVAIDPIAEALIKLDPSSELYFRERADRAKEDMQKAHERVLSSLQTVPSAKRYLVTSHDAFGYFTRTYLAEGHERDSDLWRARFAAPEGLAPDGQLSSKDIQMIIDHIALYDIKVVFAESNVSHDSLKKIVFASREKKQNVTFSQKVLYGDAMGSFEDPIMTYLEMIEKNAQSLITEWQRQ
jgi:manganese/zinc/iron transport system substrate-binding protein